MDGLGSMQWCACNMTCCLWDAAADWNPDVALVNYYRQGDTLGGHRDDVEQDQAAPIVALSLGCSAIFLLGGTQIYGPWPAESYSITPEPIPAKHRWCVLATVVLTWQARQTVP